MIYVLFWRHWFLSFCALVAARKKHKSFQCMAGVELLSLTQSVSAFPNIGLPCCVYMVLFL